MVLCFGFMPRMELVTHLCCGKGWAALAHHRAGKIQCMTADLS